MTVVIALTLHLGFFFNTKLEAVFSFEKTVTTYQRTCYQNSQDRSINFTAMKASNLVRDKNILNVPTPVQSKIDDRKEAEKKRAGKLECAQETSFESVCYTLNFPRQTGVCTCELNSP